MASEKIITAHVEETGNSIFAVSINVSGHIIEGDEPADSGGGDLGPAPYDLLVAALGECTCMTVRFYARKQNWPLDKVEVVVMHHKMDAEKPADPTQKPRQTDVFEKNITLYGDQLTPEQRAKLIEVAAKCPVQRTLQSEVVIKTTG